MRVELADFLVVGDERWPKKYISEVVPKLRDCLYLLDNSPGIGGRKEGPYFELGSASKRFKVSMQDRSGESIATETRTQLLHHCQYYSGLVRLRR